MKDVLNEINADVKDILKLGFELTQTQNDFVPNYEDPGLTFESGRNKKAKLIETCVLYADIRNSTNLSKAKSKDIMAKLYSAFVKSVLKVAEYHGGVIRNIIGDRVMVVFPQKDCFTNAIDTAISINTVASRIINKHFTGFDFKVGIGIDYGEMMVIKAGIPKQDKERTNYKNLVWIGNPANIASKLTDVANKEISYSIIKVYYKTLRLHDGKLLYDLFPKSIELNAEEFVNLISYVEDTNISFSKGKFVKFEKTKTEVKSNPILMSQKVWEEFKKNNPERNSVKNGLWNLQNVKVPEYTGQIIGGDVYWTSIDDIKL